LWEQGQKLKKLSNKYSPNEVRKKWRDEWDALQARTEKWETTKRERSNLWNTSGLQWALKTVVGTRTGAEEMKRQVFILWGEEEMTGWVRKEKKGNNDKDHGKSIYNWVNLIRREREKNFHDNPPFLNPNPIWYPCQIWSCRDTVTVQSNYRELDWAAGVTLLQ
jgi:hypothetical protein